MRLDFLYVTILIATTASQAAAARWTAETPDAPMRKLHQDASNTRCPVGCEEGSCVLDASSGGYKCTKCQNNLIVSALDGSCTCPAGRYAQANTTNCLDCEKGSWCAGASFTATSHPEQVACGTDLTTTGKRATSIRACVNAPGYFYSVDSSGVPSSTICPVDTYGPGLKKQRACVPCPPGYTTNTATGQDSSRDCAVKQGYFVKGPGQVAPCPKGEYKAGYAAATSCTKCPVGTTTLVQASVSAADCTAVLPGWYPYSMGTGYVTVAHKCPQSYYCAGGVPTAVFSPASPLVTSGSTVVRCPFGTWTQEIASTTASQCMTPPGYKTIIDGSEGNTTKCVDGEYRPEWKPAIAASACLTCGAKIYSSVNEQVTVYAITPDATPTADDVRATASSCYIKAGQGMYYSPSIKAFYASNCDNNNYGVPDTTYGLSAYPCRDCASGLVSTKAYSSSAAYYVEDSSVSPARGGFTNPLACVTKPGFGYNGRTAAKCPAGSWNPAGTLTSCKLCGYGLSTQDSAENQVDASNCTLTLGYGVHSGAVTPCPVGTYNDKLQNDTTSPCTGCPVGFTSALTGGTSNTSCNVCQAGWGDSTGGSNCSTQCGGAAGATFGPAGRDSTSEGRQCENCSVSTGFGFDYLAASQLFIPDTVARTGADSSADCLAQYAQILDDTWYLGGSATLTQVTGVTTLEDCVASCTGDASCQYVTFHYEGGNCYVKRAAAGSNVIAFKAVIPGGSAAASLAGSKGDKVRPAAMASGAYTFWINQDTTGVGADTSTSGSITSIQSCLASCDIDGECTAVVMGGVTNATSTPTSCVMLKGDTAPATFKRTLTKAVVTRLDLATLFA